MFTPLFVALLLGAPPDGPKGRDKTEGKELKVLARGEWKPAGTKDQQQLEIRSAEELARVTGNPADKAVEELAKAFKVESIDWKKQMVVVASGGTKTTGGYGVEITELKEQDGVLIVHWKLHTPKPGSPVTKAITHPAQAVLVERFDGKVVFDPPAPKEGKKGEK
jgi:hypothetical protein